MDVEAMYRRLSGACCPVSGLTDRQIEEHVRQVLHVVIDAHARTPLEAVLHARARRAAELNGTPEGATA